MHNPRRVILRYHGIEVCQFCRGHSKRIRRAREKLPLTPAKVAPASLRLPHSPQTVPHAPAAIAHVPATVERRLATFQKEPARLAHWPARLSQVRERVSDAPMELFGVREAVSHAPVAVAQVHELVPRVHGDVPEWHGELSHVHGEIPHWHGEPSHANEPPPQGRGPLPNASREAPVSTLVDRAGRLSFAVCGGKRGRGGSSIGPAGSENQCRAWRGEVRGLPCEVERPDLALAAPAIEPRGAKRNIGQKLLSRTPIAPKMKMDGEEAEGLG
jgi:hypothetical protein